MGKITTIIKKNLKLMLRSKASVTIMLLGPMFLMFVVGVALDTEGEDRIDIGYVEKEKTELSGKFIDSIHEEDYDVRTIENTQECRFLIGKGELHICIVFPKNFDIGSGNESTVDFIVDNSQINIFSSVVNSMESKLNRMAMELSTGMTQDIVSRLNQTTTELTEKTDIVSSIKQDHHDLTKKLEETGEDISSMEISFDVDGLNLGGIDSFGNVILDFNNLAMNLVDESFGVIDDVEDFIDEINLTVSEEDDILLILDEGRDEINEIENELDERSSMSAAEFSDLMDDLKGSIGNLEDRLIDARTIKEDTIENIDEIKLITAQSLSKVEDVEKTFNAVISVVEGADVTDVESIVNPVKKNVKLVHSEETNLNFYFPYLIILIIMFVGTLLASNLVFMEKSSKAYFRNFVTPTKDFSFIAGTYITTMIMIVIQLTFIFLVYTLYFGKDVLENLPTVVLVLFIASSIFIFIGMLIGNLFNSNESNMLGAISISGVMLFISDLIYPLQRMPETIAELAKLYNPFYVTSDLLRKTMVHNVDYYSVSDELFVVFLTAFLLLIFVWLTYRLMKRLFILRFAGYITRKNLKKQTKEANKQKIYNNIKKLSEPFVTLEEKKLKDLSEIIEFLRSLNKHDFRKYVNNDKNMFAEWASKNIADDEFTSRLYKTKSRLKTINLFKKEKKFFEKYEKKTK